MMTKKKNIQTICFWVVSIGLVLVILFLAGLTVHSHDGVYDKDRDHYYCEMSKELTDRTRAFLIDKGFKNCGVAVTRQVEEDGHACFTITVHHDLMNYLNDDERAALLEEMQALSFEDNYCSFRYVFLNNEA